MDEHARFTLVSQWMMYKRPMDDPLVKEKPIGKGERVRIGQSPVTHEREIIEYIGASEVSN